jgi:tRNA pseudouridine38-40 synthase
MRYALKFAYDGQEFEGYARQPDMRTVEGEVIKAMQSLGIIDDTRSSAFQSASRTDRGVSAAGNVIAIETGFDKDALITALNSKLEGAVFWAVAGVGDDFNARHAKVRWYRYVLPKSRCPDLDGLQTSSGRFVGEHDFREYSKKDTGDEDTVLTIDSVDINKTDDFLYIDFKAQRFLWQMVRRLVAEITGAWSGPAPAENLILMDVAYDFTFTTVAENGKSFSDSRTGALIRSEILGQIIGSAFASEV